MIKLKQAVIVEGKFDKIRLKNVVDALIIETGGFGIYRDKERMALIKALAEGDGIIILTDSDRAGFQIRNLLRGRIRDGKIINVYIPDIFGKEKRKEKPSAEGKLGVEGIAENVLLEAFLKAGVCAMGGEVTEKKSVTRAMLFDDGFIGGEGSHEKRLNLQKELRLPENLGTNALLEVLSAIYGADEYIKIVNKMKEN